MNFKDLKIKRTYDSDRPGVNILREFYIPVLESSLRYDRVGSYFRSSIFLANTKGIAKFIKNGGIIRLIGDVEITKNDLEAINNGKEKIVDEKIEIYFDEQLSIIKENIRADRYLFLSYLIASKKLELKIAVVEDSNEHSKVGIFYDNNQNGLAFKGSINESMTGWTKQGNNISVYCSWKEEQDNYFFDAKTDFERKWNNQGKITKVYEFPFANKFVKNITFDQKDKNATKDFLQKIIDDDDKPDFLRKLEEVQNYKPNLPDWLRKKGLRKYQKSMIDLWVENDRKGIFEMATGTGKTVTALAAATDLCNEVERLLIIVCCPTSILVDQWMDEADNFKFSPVKGAGSYKKWNQAVRNLKIEFMEGDRTHGMIITNKQTLFDTKHNKLMSQVKDFGETPILLIADEVHNLGSRNIRKSLPEKFAYRIGLTATPKRYFDEDGTNALFEYFGYSLPHEPPIDLKYALENDYLCPYNYYPIIIYLNEEETYQYHDLTKKINKLRSYKTEDDENLKYLYRKRTLIINNAENKIEGLNRLITVIGKKKQSLFFLTEKQIDNVAELLINSHGYHLTRITSDFKSQYNEIKKNFSDGMTDGLLAIKVIDEGLDIPSTKNGFFLASTGNPKQFIQRRGRLMRKSENKTHANIYDFLVLPNGNVEEGTNIVKKALSIELKRFVEFAELALNYEEARNVLLKLALDNGIYDI